jgi:hypothetical protein
MKKNFLSIAFVVVFMLTATSAKAQWSDLMKTGNLNKAVNSVTGKSAAIFLPGTWVYSGSAVEFESDNVFKKVSGAAAASIAQNKIDSYLKQAGIQSGKMLFIFKNDGTFTSVVGSHNCNGTYTYSAGKLNLKYQSLYTTATVKRTSSGMELLFNANKLITMLKLAGNLSNNTSLSLLSSFAGSYKDMLMGLNMKKK